MGNVEEGDDADFMWIPDSEKAFGFKEDENVEWADKTAESAYVAGYIYQAMRRT